MPGEYAALLRVRAARQAKRAAARDAQQALQTHLDEAYSYRMRLKMHNGARSAALSAAKRNVREDWAVGPRLMPRRDIGGGREAYATMDQQLAYPPDRPARLREWKEKAPFAKGDRVVILVGQDRGRIDVVETVDTEAQSVTLQKYHRMSLTVPDFLKQENNLSSSHLVSTRRRLAFSDARLVHTMSSGDRGGRDVIVEELELRLDPITGKHRRYIRGLSGQHSEEIPWPAEEVDPPSKEQTDDTSPEVVETRTFAPSQIHVAPFPSSVIDEVRDKYDKARKRHDPEWVAEKEAELAAKQQREKNMADRAREIAWGRRSPGPIQRERARQKLSEEQLIAIGKAMLEEKESRVL